MEELINGALQRGLDYSAFEDMEVGAIVDFVITYNNANNKTNRQNTTEEDKNITRSATQDDWERFSNM